MGFKDGTANLDVRNPATLDQHVWVGDEGGAWMRGGSYAVVRPDPHRDRAVGQDEACVPGADGRAPQGVGRADRRHGRVRTCRPRQRTTRTATRVIAENAHLRLAAPGSNDGAQILRRGYSYDNGIALIAERWPPWRHVVTLDAGLFFICYQRDPRTGFIKIFDRMSKFDMMNQFVTPVGGGLFACPGGVQPGRYLAQDLFEA